MVPTKFYAESLENESQTFSDYNIIPNFFVFPFQRLYFFRYPLAIVGGAGDPSTIRIGVKRMQNQSTVIQFCYDFRSFLYMFSATYLWCISFTIAKMI